MDVRNVTVGGAADSTTVHTYLPNPPIYLHGTDALALVGTRPRLCEHFHAPHAGERDPLGPNGTIVACDVGAGRRRGDGGDGDLRLLGLAASTRLDTGCIARARS